MKLKLSRILNVTEHLSINTCLVHFSGVDVSQKVFFCVCMSSHVNLFYLQPVPSFGPVRKLFLISFPVRTFISLDPCVYFEL